MNMLFGYATVYEHVFDDFDENRTPADKERGIRNWNMAQDLLYLIDINAT